MSRDFLSIRNLDAGYGAAQALFNINLSVAKGERVAIVGHNGWGKTTLARSLAGFLSPTAGSVNLGGVELVGLPAHKVARNRVALVPQGREVFKSLSVEENLRVAASGPEEKRRWKEIYEIFPRLAERAHQMASTLSGGEQQMLAIGRALVRRPQLMILDEPTEGLAPYIVDLMCESLKQHAEAEQFTLLLLEQRVGFAEALCDRVIHMEGRGVLPQHAAVS